MCKSRSRAQKCQVHLKKKAFAIDYSYYLLHELDLTLREIITVASLIELAIGKLRNGELPSTCSHWNYG